MVNETDQPERGLILMYAPASGRGGLAALLALDDALAQLLRTTREPSVGQLRLAWWREALARLDQAPAPAEPVLQGLATQLVAQGVPGESLVPIVHGWEVLVEAEQLDADALTAFGAGRGSLFEAAGRLFGDAAPAGLATAGQGWALADLARHLEDGAEAEFARSLARPLLDQALAKRWPRPFRALGAMTRLAAMDLDLPNGTPPPIGAPGRVGRLLWHRFTGR